MVIIGFKVDYIVEHMNRNIYHQNMIFWIEVGVAR